MNRIFIQKIITLNKADITIFFVLVFLFSVLIPNRCFSFDVIAEKLPEDKVYGDFVVGPGKFEMELEPGQSGTFDLMIANRMGVSRNFNITVEDFIGSNDLGEALVYVDDEKNPYSLSSYIKVGSTSLSIAHGTIYRIPITAKIPIDAQPGGLYASVVVNMANEKVVSNENGDIKPINNINTRVGTLVLVRVKGEVQERGGLSKFEIKGGKSIIFDSKSIIFSLLYRNDGNVHLKPTGNIIVKNMLGKVVGEVPVDSWFTLPDSVRLREVQWNPTFLFGMYTANASIQKGYGNEADQIDIVFWVFPWKVILVIIIVLITLFVLFKRFGSKKKRILITIIALLSLFGIANAEVMTSSNYKLESDSVNFSGRRSVSGSYIIEDSVGEVATGISASSNFKMLGGYQQNQTMMISVIPASNVSMSPSIPGLTGGTALGETTFTVTTDDPAGYTATINSDNSPALSSDQDSFGNYVPSGAVPDFIFTNDSATSSFAFSPEGNDIAQRYKDSGASCGAGVLDTENSCWDGLSQSPVTFLNRTSSNQPFGTVSKIKFRAESGSNNVQLDGTYTATTTITVTAL